MFANGNFIANLNAPMAGAGAKTKSGVEGKIETQGKNGRRLGGGAIVTEEGEAQAVIAGVLVGQQTEHEVFVAGGGTEGRAFGAAFKVKAAGTFTQTKQHPVQGLAAKRAIGRGATIPRRGRIGVGKKLKVAEVADGKNAAGGFFGFALGQDF